MIVQQVVSIAAGADVNIGDHDGQTPLMHEIQTGHRAGVGLLLGAKGNKIHMKDVGGEALLLVELD